MKRARSKVAESTKTRARRNHSSHFQFAPPSHRVASSPHRATGAQDMFGQSDSNDYQPLGYLGRIPLYVTTLLVIAYVVAMVALVLCQAGNVPYFANLLVYNSDAVRQQYQVWRFFTYPLVNGPSIWFAVEMYMLYAFGREVERFIGRASYGMLYLTLVLLGPCLLTAASVWTPAYLPLSGSQGVNFAVFIAFCAIYPNVEIFFTIKAKWIAAVFLGIVSLQLLAEHASVALLIFWATCLAAFLFIKYLRGHIQFRFSLRDYLRRRRSQRSLRSVPKPRPTLESKPPSPRDDVIESIDPLLDKIAKHGIGSLTARERERLEEARAELLKKPLS
jgi:membrane associated rhomboid family serine protease